MFISQYMYQYRGYICFSIFTNYIYAYRLTKRNPLLLPQYQVNTNYVYINAKYCTNINIKKEKKIDFFFKYITAIHIPSSINVTLI